MYNIPNTQEKLLCAVLYICPLLSAGSLLFWLVNFAPIIFFVYTRSKNIHIKDFVKYHCLQAVLLNMIVFFLPDVFNLLVSFLANIYEIILVFIKSVSASEFASEITVYSNSLLALVEKFTLIVNSLYFILIKVLAFYAVVWTFRGKYTYIPPVSQAVNQVLR